MDKGYEIHQVESIRNQCLQLLSGLIEVFGDAAVQAILLVVQNIFATCKSDSSQQTQSSQRQSEDAGKDQEEEKKQVFEDDGDIEPEQLQRMREAEEFKALLEELIYISTHPKNVWKRREVAILMISAFVEDVSMYMTRNPDYEML